MYIIYQFQGNQLLKQTPSLPPLPPPRSPPCLKCSLNSLLILQYNIWILGPVRWYWIHFTVICILHSVYMHLHINPHQRCAWHKMMSSESFMWCGICVRFDSAVPPSLWGTYSPLTAQILPTLTCRRRCMCPHRWVCWTVYHERADVYKIKMLCRIWSCANACLPNSSIRQSILFNMKQKYGFVRTTVCLYICLSPDLPMCNTGLMADIPDYSIEELNLTPSI